MLEYFLLVSLLSALVLTLGASAGLLILHKMYGAEIPEGVLPLHNAFRSVYLAGSSVILAPIKWLTSGSSDDEPKTPLVIPPKAAKALPAEEVKQITKVETSDEKERSRSGDPVAHDEMEAK
jgi:hypothetical protein